MNALEFRFAFYARDFETSIRFYRDLLGCTPVDGWWDRPDGKGALFSVGGSGVIEIYGAAAGGSYEGPSPTALNLALRLENAPAVDAFYQGLAGMGVERMEPPQDRSWGHRSSSSMTPMESQFIFIAASNHPSEFCKKFYNPLDVANLNG